MKGPLLLADQWIAENALARWIDDLTAAGLSGYQFIEGHLAQIASVRLGLILLKNSESAQIRVKECPKGPVGLLQLRGRPNSDAGHQSASQ